MCAGFSARIWSRSLRLWLRWCWPHFCRAGRASGVGVALPRPLARGIDDWVEEERMRICLRFNTEVLLRVWPKFGGDVNKIRKIAPPFQVADEVLALHRQSVATDDIQRHIFLDAVFL